MLHRSLHKSRFSLLMPTVKILFTTGFFVVSSRKTIKKLCKLEGVQIERFPSNWTIYRCSLSKQVTKTASSRRETTLTAACVFQGKVWNPLKSKDFWKKNQHNHCIKMVVLIWRRAWDSNPRTGSTPIKRFRVVLVMTTSIRLHNAGLKRTQKGYFLQQYLFYIILHKMSREKIK